MGGVAGRQKLKIAESFCKVDDCFGEEKEEGGSAGTKRNLPGVASLSQHWS